MKITNLKFKLDNIENSDCVYFTDSETNIDWVEMKTQHTPTPWKVSNYRPHFIISRDPNESTYEKGDDKFAPVLVCNDLDDAAFIVRAVNAYDNLVAALEAMRKAARNCINTGPSPYDDNYPLELRELSDAWTIADTVLAKARGEL